jgi:hypothetical protein
MIYKPAPGVTRKTCLALAIYAYDTRLSAVFDGAEYDACISVACDALRR